MYCIRENVVDHMDYFTFDLHTFDIYTRNVLNYILIWILI